MVVKAETFLLLFSVTFCYAASSSDGNGYKGLEWGASIEQAKTKFNIAGDVVKGDCDDALEIPVFQSVPQGDHEFDDMQGFLFQIPCVWLRSASEGTDSADVDFYFDDGKLFAAYISLPSQSPSDSKALVHKLVQRYGDPIGRSDQKGNFFWWDHGLTRIVHYYFMGTGYLFYIQKSKFKSIRSSCRTYMKEKDHEQSEERNKRLNKVLQ